MNADTLHDADRFAWFERQTRVLSADALGELDIMHLIQELGRDFWPEC